MTAPTIIESTGAADCARCNGTGYLYPSDPFNEAQARAQAPECPDCGGTGEDVGPEVARDLRSGKGREHVGTGAESVIDEEGHGLAHDRAYLSALASEPVESADLSRRCDNCDEVRPEAGGKSYMETWPCDVDGGDQVASWWICGECCTVKAQPPCPCLERPADVGGLCAECRAD